MRSSTSEGSAASLQPPPAGARLAGRLALLAPPRGATLLRLWLPLPLPLERRGPPAAVCEPASLLVLPMWLPASRSVRAASLKASGQWWWVAVLQAPPRATNTSLQPVGNTGREGLGSGLLGCLAAAGNGSSSRQDGMPPEGMAAIGKPEAKPHLSLRL